MDIYNIRYNKNLNIDKHFKNTNICFLDIETTGFSRKKNIIYLVGILYNKNKHWYVKQFFANSISKEKELILEIANFLKYFNTIITYNGNNFDINFLNHKFKQYKLEYTLDKKNSFDIYQILRRENLFLNLDSLKLESVEEYIGINRKDTLNGKDCIDHYYKYINSNNEEYKNLILQHNYEDLIYLPEILKVLDIIEEKKTIKIASKDKIINTKIINIQISKEILKVNSYIPNLNIEPIIIYEKYYNLYLEPKKNLLIIEVELKKGLLSTKENCFYVDIRQAPYRNSIEDKSRFNLPKDLITIKIGDKFQIKNIKSIIKKIVESSLQSYFL